MSTAKLFFASDYMEGAHENIIRKLTESNMEHSVGYGMDEYTASAVERIRQACKCPGAEVKLLVGGTQTNETVISAALRPYQGAIAADTGHIACHEAGAIEHGGHKVLPLKGIEGKINAQQVDQYLRDFFDDGNHDHMVEPGMVYISQPTEYGTLYSLAELTALSQVAHQYGLVLYVDGARLAYALASKENDVSLADMARLCDVFYIGGTKCGALFGEAVVVPDPKLIPHFFTIIKQHGALLAKGRILGIQFDELFKDDLYMTIGTEALVYAAQIKAALKRNGYRLAIESPTNQIMFIIDNDQLAKLDEKVVYSFWEKYDETHTVIRFATSWATQKADVDQLIRIMDELGSEK